MKEIRGGFMKKRISCKVIKSIPLRNEDFRYSYGDISKVRSLISSLNFFHTESRAVIYTKKMAIEKEPFNDNLPEQSIDFYA